MTIQDILTYIDRSPYSINKSILKGMLESLNVESAGAEDVPQVELEELVVKKNGVFRAPEGKAYSKIVVNVKGEKKDGE